MKRKLVQISLIPKAYDQLKDLQKRTGSTTITEVIKFALAIFRWMVEKQSEGYDIYAVPNEKDGYRKAEKIQMLLPL